LNALHPLGGPVIEGHLPQKAAPASCGGRLVQRTARCDDAALRCAALRCAALRCAALRWYDLSCIWVRNCGFLLTLAADVWSGPMTVILRRCHGNLFLHRHNVLLTLLLEAAVMALRPATNIMCAHPGVPEWLHCFS
jgi:hypothetical protein